MKKTHLAGLFLLVQFVCYCKIFHNLTHKVNNPYLLDKNWMIVLTVGLLGFALANIIDAMMKPRHENIQSTEKLIDNGSKTSRFIKTAFSMAIPIILGSFMLNYLINPNSLKALEHAQNSTKAFFITGSIGIAIAALVTVISLLACCCCCCCLLGNKNQLDKEINEGFSTLDQNNLSQQSYSSELPNYNSYQAQSKPTEKQSTEEQPPAYDAKKFPQQAKSFAFKAGSAALNFLT